MSLIFASSEFPYSSRCRDNLSSPIAPTWGNRALLAQKGPHRGPSWAPKIKGKVNPYDFGPKLGEIEFSTGVFSMFQTLRTFWE